jgi:microcompartment protein CcmL/EutN
MEDYAALGFVETMGLVAAIEAADAMVKAARVRVKTVVNADGGLISVVCEGDLAACKAAVDAGKAAAERVGQCLRTNLIPRPYSETEHLITERVDRIADKRPSGRTAPPKPKGRGRDEKGKK